MNDWWNSNQPNKMFLCVKKKPSIMSCRCRDRDDYLIAIEFLNVHRRKKNIDLSKLF